MSVPRMTAALTGPLLDLERELLKAMPNIERRFSRLIEAIFSHGPYKTGQP